MKQFVFLNKKVSVAPANNGEYAFYTKNGEIADLSAISEDYFNLAVMDNGFLKTIPIHKNKLTYVKSTYEAATKYTADINFEEGEYEKGTYSIIIAKKGVKFDERNKWTVSTYLNKNKYADNVIDELVKQINKLDFVKATAGENKLTITATEYGVDYKVIVADNLSDMVVTETNAVQAINDAKMIIDLYNKCAADNGINYTYKDADIYPTHQFNPLANSNSEDVGFNVFTLRFAEPRITKTTDEVINQVVHVVESTDSASFETELMKLETVDETNSVNEESLVDETNEDEPTKVD